MAVLALAGLPYVFALNLAAIWVAIAIGLQ